MNVLIVLVLCLIQILNADIVTRCSNETRDTLDFIPSPKKDSLFIVEWCTKLNDPNVTKWKMDLYFSENLEMCDEANKDSLRRYYNDNFGPHSHFEEEVNLNPNCTQVCLQVPVDLIFKACYEISCSIFYDRPDYTPRERHYHKKIDSSLTLDYLKNTTNEAVINMHIMDPVQDYFVATWFLPLPAVSFDLSLCSDRAQRGIDDDCEDATRNCTGDEEARRVRCRLAPPHGRYLLWLERRAPWGQMKALMPHLSKSLRVEFLAPAGAHGPAAGADWRPAAGCGAVLALAALGWAALLAWRSKQARDWQKAALRYWQNYSKREVEVPPPAAEPRHVLLVYAREGEEGERVSTALRELLEHVVPGEVLDLYSPATLALAGGAPADWLRGVLARDSVRVLLLQTPALAALCRAELGPQDLPVLQEPLLGRVAAYRGPHFGDVLLQLTLRAAAAAAPADQRAYRKYYVAQLSGVPTAEALWQLAPFRRYELPGALPLLLQHACGADVPAELLLPLRQAAEDFALHVQRNPAYLMDSLMLL